jgi:hypothetical protein
LTAPPRLDLAQPRTLGPLLADSLRIYFRHFRAFLVIGAGVVVPAELIVSGIGLHELTSGVDTDPGLAASLVPLVVRALVTSPLITAMTVYALLDLADGRAPSIRRATQSGLDAFRAVFVPVMLAVAIEALATLALVVPLAVAVGSALVPTLAVPLILAVRWYFVPQSVVVQDARGFGALRTSWETTRGSGWRVAGIVVLAFVLLATAGGVIATPVVVAARAADSGALLTLSTIVSEALAAPALAIVSVLLYFDLRSRGGARV